MGSYRKLLLLVRSFLLLELISAARSPLETAHLFLDATQRRLAMPGKRIWRLPRLIGIHSMTIRIEKSL